MYSGIGVIMAKSRGAEDELNTVVAGTSTGLLYKCSGKSEINLHPDDYIQNYNFLLINYSVITLSERQGVKFLFFPIFLSILLFFLFFSNFLLFFSHFTFNLCISF